MERAIEHEDGREAQVERGVLDGNQGLCTDYKRTNDFGFARQPFTWLSDGVDGDNQRIADTLLALQRSRSVARFEAWEVEEEAWRLIHSGQVQVLYVELDSRINRVRALLQWAQVTTSTRELAPQIQDRFVRE